jgi:hypothetical protein
LYFERLARRRKRRLDTQRSTNTTYRDVCNPWDLFTMRAKEEAR